MSKKTEETGSDDRFYKFIQDFNSVYLKLADKAEMNTPMTETEGWRKKCEAARDEHAEECKNVASGLNAAANIILDKGIDEGIVKGIKEIVKGAVEIHDSYTYFQTQVIDPVANSARDCDKFIKDTLEEATNLDEHEPLYWKGIQHCFEDSLQTVTRYRWNGLTYSIERVLPGEK